MQPTSSKESEAPPLDQRDRRPRSKRPIPFLHSPVSWAQLERDVCQGSPSRNYTKFVEDDRLGLGAGGGGPHAIGGPKPTTRDPSSANPATSTRVGALWPTRRGLPAAAARRTRRLRLAPLRSPHLQETDRLTPFMRSASHPVTAGSVRRAPSCRTLAPASLGYEVAAGVGRRGTPAKRGPQTATQTSARTAKVVGEEPDGPRRELGSSPAGIGPDGVEPEGRASRSGAG
jgi:hypothetical protein